MIPQSRLSDIHHFKTIHRHVYSSEWPNGYYNIIQIRWKPIQKKTWFGYRETVPKDTEFYFKVGVQDHEYQNLYNWLMNYMKTEDPLLDFDINDAF